MNLDLNLVRSFVTLYDEGSVTKAASRLGISQPSMSYALSRLRRLLDDRLFVRNDGGMHPTRAADSLYLDLADALSRIYGAIEAQQDFDPRRSKRRFRLALTDLGQMTLLPVITAQLQAQAPDIRLEIRPLDIAQAEDWLMRGTVDALICSRTFSEPSIDRHVLFSEHYVALIDDGHPRIGQMDELSAFLDERHVVVDPGSGHGLVQEMLANLGDHRRTSLVVPHFSSLPRLIENTELVTVLPIRIAQSFKYQSRVRVIPLPFDVPSFDVALYWYRNAARSQAHRWFRDSILRALSEQPPDTLGTTR